MEVRFEIPDYFKAVVGSKTSAELSVLFQMVLLNPSILNTVKGLEVDSVIALEYLSKILAIVERPQPVIMQSINPDFSPAVIATPDIDLSSLMPDQLNVDDEDDDPFNALANFLEGG